MKVLFLFRLFHKNPLNLPRLNRLYRLNSYFLLFIYFSNSESVDNISVLSLSMD
jgi:hypothetical protein